MNQYLIGSSNEIVTTWTCDDRECSEKGKTVEVFMSEWPDMGTPQCLECDRDLVLLSPVYGRRHGSAWLDRLSLILIGVVIGGTIVGFLLK